MTTIVTRAGKGSPLTNTEMDTNLTNLNTAKIENTNSNTGSTPVASGTEAQRDGTPSAGYFRFNTDSDAFEGYNGTAWGAIGGGSSFAAGTVMLFAQTAAPTGWTKDTVNYNNYALRLVTGAVSTGGSVGFTTAFASQTPAGSVSVNTSGLSVGATTLTTAQIPSHTHSLYGYVSGQTYGGEGAFGWGSASTNATGGGGSHSHSMSGSATGSFTGSAMNLAVQYVDIIRATKD